jgi:hypothetical protein
MEAQNNEHKEGVEHVRSPADGKANQQTDQHANRLQAEKYKKRIITARIEFLSCLRPL